MGNIAPSDKQPVCPVEMLSREKPTQLMAQLLAVWPEVQEALRAGHTLRLVHQRLNLVGVPISYKLLSLYRGRIERRKKATAASVSPNTVGSASRQNHTPPGFDPLANFDAQERKRRAAWQYPPGLPDINKLAK